MSDVNTGAAANAAPAELGRPWHVMLDLETLSTRKDAAVFQIAAPAELGRPWHVMLDIETLSTRKDAAVFQIAALCFDPETGETGPAFCAFIKPEDVRGHLDVGTLAWWMTQQACDNVSRRWQNDGYRGVDVLTDFGEWMADLDVKALWSHGATFDIVVLENQYAGYGLCKPWHYRVERDTRTLYALAYADGKPPAVPVDETRKHDAAYDCEVQAQQVTLAWRKLETAKHALVELMKERAGCPA